MSKRKGVFLVLSQPRSDSPEDVAAFNKWYDEVHTRDSLLLPGFVRARRFKLADEQLLPARATAPGFGYLALYEVDDVDQIPAARELLPGLREISAEFFSPALDPESVRAFIFEQIAEIDEPTSIPDGVRWPPDGA